MSICCVVVTPTELVIAISVLMICVTSPVTVNFASKANAPPVVVELKYAWKSEVASTRITPGCMVAPLWSKNVKASCDAE